MFPAHFSFKLVHNLHKYKNKETCLRKSSSLPTSLCSEPIISSCSLKKLVKQMRLSHIFSPSTTEMFIQLLMHYQWAMCKCYEYKIPTGKWEAISEEREGGFFRSYMYVFSIYPLCTNIVNMMQDLPFPRSPAMQVDDFLKRKKDLLELDIKCVIWFPLVTHPYFCQQRQAVQNFSSFYITSINRKQSVQSKTDMKNPRPHSERTAPNSLVAKCLKNAVMCTHYRQLVYILNIYDFTIS